MAKASAFSVVLSLAEVPGMGDLPLMGIDERILVPFASVCREKSPVKIEVRGQVVQFKCKNKEITVPLRTGKDNQLPSLQGAQHIDITTDIAKKIVFLSNIAFNDSSRAEMCCVMLVADGRAMACNQKTIAALKCHSGGSTNIALPLPLAKILSNGDRISVTTTESVVKSGIAHYAMPCPIKAQNEFPIALVEKFSSLDREIIAVCDSKSFTNAVAEALTCLGSMNRMELLLQLNISGEKLELKTESGGAKFRVVIKLKEQKEEGQLKLPLEYTSQACQFLKDDDLSLARGKNRETFLLSGDAWAVFPEWKER
jgi:hypothetical protein